MVCTALDQCHVAGVCDPASGLCSDPAKADGSACDDGRFCTVDDTCTAGVCGGAARDCSALADPCNDGTCDEDAEQCEQTPKPDGTACDDGDACTQTDTCTVGICFGNPVVCVPEDACHTAGTCDPATGTCSGEAIICADNDPCTADSCDPAKGCVFQPLTGAPGVNCLLDSPAFDACHPIPPAIAAAIAQAQNRLTLARVTPNFVRAQQLYGQAMQLLKRAGKKALKMTRTRRLSPQCGGALSRNLFEASGRVLLLRLNP